MNSYLTADDKAWIAHHLKLARSAAEDIIKFSAILLSKIEVNSEEPKQRSPEDLVWERREEFLQFCRPATANDYRVWLRGYENRTGRLRRTHDYDLSETKFFVLEENPSVLLPELYGSAAISLIVPGNIVLGPIPRNFHGCSGHNKIFFMRRFYYLGSGRVPRYANT